MINDLFAEGNGGPVQAGPPTSKPVRKIQKNKAHQVYRLKDGTRVPGASTVAKIGSDPAALLHWAWKCGCDGLDYRKVRDTAADIGTITHFRIECHILGYTPDLSDFATNDIQVSDIPFQKFLEWWGMEELSVIEPEAQLVSEHYRYGGTIDIPCYDKAGRLVLIDWKTSKAIWPEHLIQLSGYEELLNEDFRKRPFERVRRRAIVRIGKKGLQLDEDDRPLDGNHADFEVRWLSDMNAYFSVFQAQLAFYQAKKRIKG